MDDPRIKQVELFAWIGEDEYGSGKIGIKSGFCRAGFVPLVAVDRSKMDDPYFREGLSRQSRAFGKTIRLLSLRLCRRIGHARPLDRADSGAR